MGVEEPVLVTRYGLYLQPIMIISILLGIYSLTIVTKTLQPVAPGNRAHLSFTYFKFLYIYIYDKYLQIRYYGIFLLRA